MKTKKILVLCFSNLRESTYWQEIEEGFSKSVIFSGKKLYNISLEREVDQFDLPLDSACFLGYDSVENSSMVFKVGRYSSEINEDFSEETIFIYLKFSHFVGYNTEKIVSYLEKNWKI